MSIARHGSEAAIAGSDLNFANDDPCVVRELDAASLRISVVRRKEREEMSARMANVIAIELAVLIGVLVWLGLPRVPSVQMRPAVEQPTWAYDSPASVMPMSQGTSREFQTEDNEVAPENSAEAIDEQPQVTPESVQEVVTEPDPGVDFEPDLVADAAPSYAAVDEAPVVAAPGFYAAPVAEFVEFIQPSQVVVAVNPRSCRRRGRWPARSCDPSLPVVQRCPRGGSLPARGGGVAPRGNVGGSPPLRQNVGGGTVPGQNSRVGVPPRPNVSSRVVPPNQVLKARWEP